MGTHDATTAAWEAERQRLQREVIEAAQRLLAHTGAAGFEVRLPDDRPLTCGIERRTELTERLERTLRGLS